ncbi:MAG: TRAP transporter substrate-binding protein [Dehalococcoidia bacterium]|nr:TRAP transporter substrate-binding protein [Dehalococcoidia bacterium]
MKRKKSLAVVGGLCLALMIAALPLATACAPGPSEGEPAAPAQAEYKWRMGNSWTQLERNTSMQLFADLIHEYSGGRIEVEFFPDGLLGTHDELFHAVMDGSVEMGNLCPYVHLLPGGMLNWMPWTTSSYDEAAIAYSAPDGILYKVMTSAYEEVGTKYLWACPTGPYGIGNNIRPLKTPDDFENWKFRVSGSLGFVKTMEHMSEGSVMTLETIPWADLYNALERGVVDGCWSLWGSLIEERHYEVLKYYTDLGFGWDCNNVNINMELWDSLPADLQDVIFRASRAAEERDFEAHRRIDIEYKKKLVDLGLEIYYPTPAEKDAFRQKANMMSIWEELCTPWLDEHFPGQNMTKVMLDELARISAEVTAAGG